MKQELSETLTARMENSFGGIGATLDKVTGMEIAGIPVGEAAIGGALTVLLVAGLVVGLVARRRWARNKMSRLACRLDWAGQWWYLHCINVLHLHTHTHTHTRHPSVFT